MSDVNIARAVSAQMQQPSIFPHVSSLFYVEQKSCSISPKPFAIQNACLYVCLTVCAYNIGSSIPAMPYIIRNSTHSFTDVACFACSMRAKEDWECRPKWYELETRYMFVVRLCVCACVLYVRLCCSSACTIREWMSNLYAMFSRPCLRFGLLLYSDVVICDDAAATFAARWTLPPVPVLCRPIGHPNACVQNR